MQHKFYGKVKRRQPTGDFDCWREELENLGYTIILDLYTAAEIPMWRKRIDAVYQRQADEFGRDALEAIQDLDIARAPLLYQDDFLSMATHPLILSLMKEIFGEWFILNLQNAVINRPQLGHHQTAWHRDLPYQNFTSSQPLSVNVLFVIDDFSVLTGGTQVLPCSHRSDTFPSDAYLDAHKTQVAAPAGSAIVFDSMLFHRAGVNTSQAIRRAVNHTYTVPILKQQYDFPRAMTAAGRGADYFTPEVSRLLGFSSQVAMDDRSWRSARIRRTKGA
jgi:ectoine hydroxylase-related dioxygenase (phytanoyl-CoA dioxygenase family)